LRILVLDDNPEAVQIFDSFLKALDHKVSCYTDPREALLWLTDVKPELLIVDLCMPEMSGYDFLKRVRAYGAYSRTPIVALTGTEASDDEIEAHGFASVLRKPVTLSDIMTAIEELETVAKTEDANTELEHEVSEEISELEPTSDAPVPSDLT
jgi:CheY-like chemotaxis protein